MKAGILACKVRHVQRQAARTRSREQIDANDQKINVFRDKFNTACKALIALGMDESEIDESREIADVDLDCMEDLEREAKRTEALGKATENCHGYWMVPEGIQMHQLGCIKVRVSLCSILFPIIQFIVGLACSGRRNLDCMQNI
jgi:hypothetical protein